MPKIGARSMAVACSISSNGSLKTVVAAAASSPFFAAFSSTPNVLFT